MTMTDPIADMLTRLRNANQAYHDSAAMPSSKLKTHIAEILQQEGYIAGWTSTTSRGRQHLQAARDRPEVRPEPRAQHRRCPPGVQARSAGVREVDLLPKVLGGLGVAIISTSTGLLTDKQANKKGVGGEVLAYVW